MTLRKSRNDSLRKLLKKARLNLENSAERLHSIRTRIRYQLEAMKDTSSSTDTIFAGDPAVFMDGHSNSFAFNAHVAAVFDDMISRSVPGYRRIQSIVAGLAVETIKDGQTIYDLGCSTGTSLLNIARRIVEIRRENPAFAREAKLIGLDSSPDMVMRAHDKIAAFHCNDLVSIFQADIRETPLKLSPMIISLYTLQFLTPRDRVRTINRVFQNLTRDGVFIFAEKIKHSSDILERTITSDYDQFKRNNGYSDLEIVRKREALQNVLVPFTLEQNLQMLRSAGFKHCEVIEKELCFVTILAQR